LPEGYTEWMARWKPRQLQRRVGQRCEVKHASGERDQEHDVRDVWILATDFLGTG
jgi:hypothetical protein